MESYKDKLVLITGGSSGIGLAIASQLVKENARVAILSRQQVLLDEAMARLASLSTPATPPAISIKADVTKRTELNHILDSFTAQHGLPDVVINCAGVAHPGTFTALKPEIFDWLMSVNYFGTVNVLKNLVPAMKLRRSGIIVNISSIAGFIGLYGDTAYCASKFAISGFTDALRSELKPYCIQVSVVFPPDTQTPQLDYENKYKPYITQQVSGAANLMTADAVAGTILKNVARKKYIILPSTEGKLIYHLKNFIGMQWYPVLDLLVNSAIRKIRFG